MYKDDFIKNSFILVLSNVATGVLGFTFSIILSKVLGPEGMGLYGLIMPLYNLMCCIICGGMVTAISKIAAEFYYKEDYKNLNSSIKVSLAFDFFWSLIFILLFFLFSGFIGDKIIKDNRALYSLWVICPAMLFIALSSILKGYFYGISKVQIPAFIDIFEKAVRIMFILTIIYLLKPKSIKDTVTSAYMALALGEFISLFFLYLFYLKNKNGFPRTQKKREGRAQLLFNVLCISFPLCLNGAVTTLLGTASTLIVPRRLVYAGFDHSTALSMIGKFSGMSTNISYFPIVIIVSVCTLLIPDISKNIAANNYYDAEKRINKVISIALSLGIATMCVCLVISRELGIMFYSRCDLSPYIKWSSISVPLTFVSVTTYAILNGLSRQNILLRNSVIVSLIELTSLYILSSFRNINVYAFAITSIITALTTIALNSVEIKKKISINIDFSMILIDVLLGVLVFFLLSILKNILILKSASETGLIILISGFLFYYLLTFMLNKSLKY